MLNIDFVLSSLGNLATYSERTLTIAGREVQNQIVNLSRNKQVSPDGVPFKVLSSAYKRRKERAGHEGIPNLTLSGNYLNSVSVIAREGNNVYVGPEDAYAGQAQGLSKLREHIGIAPETVLKVEQECIEEFERMFQ